MTINIFIGFFTLGSAVASVFTQALKKSWPELPSNITALIVSVIVGGLGTSAAYILTGVEWNLKNIVCMILMVFLVWMGSMLGYDKVIQLLAQVKGGKSV